jgi:hypothetical protein
MFPLAHTLPLPGTTRTVACPLPHLQRAAACLLLLRAAIPCAPAFPSLTRMPRRYQPRHRPRPRPPTPSTVPGDPVAPSPLHRQTPPRPEPASTQAPHRHQGLPQRASPSGEHTPAWASNGPAGSLQSAREPVRTAPGALLLAGPPSPNLALRFVWPACPLPPLR